ncbi:nuclear serine protease 2 [Colletotrichum kahawae]|uniref:Nuclear serine protease 2 n=1 Tax=Colletotrichum kahawae TaxID=34407 RepID=A0AAD9YM52_COLKA|nr:nuclear serine protease 2 [Colletotrichum kahawae]
MEITGIDGDIARVLKSFVRVECAIALTPALDHALDDNFWGIGLVIDANLGLIVVSRAVVPHTACDPSIVVARSVTMKSKVVFLHPFDNFAILRFNPNLIRGSIETAVLSGNCPLQGDTADVEGNLTDWHHFLVCKKLLENQAETEGLREGDILLKLGDRPIKSMLDLTISFDDGNVGAVVFRDRKVTKVDIATLAAKDIETSRVISSCGVYL